jgi:hypothetical protein
MLPSAARATCDSQVDVTLLFTVILMFRCIYSLKEQERSDGEHILQNSLEARWVSHEIVSEGRPHSCA